MKPIKFPEANVTYAENQKEYTPLPALRHSTPNGEVISCWKLSLWERLQILLTGKLWVMLMTFHQPLTPSYFTVKKSEVISPPNLYYLHRNARIKSYEIDDVTMVYELQYRVPWIWGKIWVKAGVLQDENYLIDPLPIQTIANQLLLDRRLRSQSAAADRRLYQKMWWQVNEKFYEFQIFNHPFNHQI
jgi:hypothetical protein